MSDAAPAPARIYAPPYRLDLSSVRIDAGTGEWQPGDLADLMQQPRVSAEAGALFELAGRPSTLAYACGPTHLRVLTGIFRVRGFTAEFVEAHRPAGEFRDAFDKLVSGKLDLLATYRAYAPGPAIVGPAAVMLARPTKLQAPFLEFLSRLQPGAIIFDLAGNIARHGVPASWPPPEIVTGEANDVVADRALGQLATMTMRDAQRWAEGDRGRLELIAKARGYAAGWVHHAAQAWTASASKPRSAVTEQRKRWARRARG